MKKKLLVLAIAVVMTLSCFMLVACGNTVKNKLSYGKKYIYDGDLDQDINNATYFIFYKDGTGVYHNYHDYGGGDIVSYTIHIKYVIDTDGGVVYCFYDSFEYGADHTYYYTNHDNSEWSAVLNFTDKFLYRIDTAYPHFFVTEKFSAKTIPNFGK